jgi:methionyl-tRNA formyltransferase
VIPSRIKVEAQRRGVPVLQPEDVNAPDFLAAIRSLRPDLLVTAAYGQILSAELLAIPRLGGVNLHGSVLPAYRGAAPVARAIQRGEAETGVTVILMTPRIDAGGMLRVATTPIDPDETAGALEDRLAALGAPLVAEAVAELEAGTARVIPQDRAKVTRAPKLSKEDGLIDWSKPARAVHDHVRAMQPWPVASTFLHQAARVGAGSGPETLRLIVHRTDVLDLDTGRAPGEVAESGGDRLVVAAGLKAVRLVTVQIAGKKPMPVSDFARGHPVSPGDRFGPG